MQFEELYQPLSEDAKVRAKKVKLLICDIDGVFSDGRIYLGNQGEEGVSCLFFVGCHCSHNSGASSANDLSGKGEGK